MCENILYRSKHSLDSILERYISSQNVQGNEESER